MQTEQILEQVIAILTDVEVHFFQQDTTPERTVEFRTPERRVVHGVSIPKHPELAKKWARYVEREGLVFSTLWQVALEFARFLKICRDDEITPPAPLRGL